MIYHSCWFPRPSLPACPEFKRLDALKMAVVGYGASPFRLGLVCYDADAPYPEIVSCVPHLAFEVENLDAAIAGRNVIIAPTEPTPGLRLAFIEEGGAPVELLEIDHQLYRDEPSGGGGSVAGDMPVRYDHLFLPSLDGALGVDDLPDFCGILRGSAASECCRSGLPEQYASQPHIAFMVDDIAAALAGRELLGGPFVTESGEVRAFIEDNGVPVLLIAARTSCHAGVDR